VSLKGFHVVFIIASILISFGFGAWCLVYGRADHDMGTLLLGSVSTAGGVGLIAYGVWFLRKSKGLRSQ
jgi:hypothetical protein